MEYDGDFIRTGVPAGLRHPRIGVARLHPLAFNVNASQRRSHDIGRLGAARELLATVRRVPRVGEPMSKLELATFALSAGVHRDTPASSSSLFRRPATVVTIAHSDSHMSHADSDSIPQSLAANFIMMPPPPPAN